MIEVDGGPNAHARDERLRSDVEFAELYILEAVRPWADDPQRWYDEQPIPSFGDKTPREIVAEGRGDSLVRYLARIDQGGYA